MMKKDELVSASEVIANKLFSIPQLLNADIVFCYVSIDKEVQTQPIIERLLELGKKVCVPRCYRGGVMDARFISSLEDLDRSGPFGIPEPRDDAEIVDPIAIDFAIVPA